jgi:hypothetical protein
MFYTVRGLVLKPPEHILLSRYVARAEAEATTSSDCIADPSETLYQTPEHCQAKARVLGTHTRVLLLH